MEHNLSDGVDIVHALLGRLNQARNSSNGDYIYNITLSPQPARADTETPCGKDSGPPLRMPRTKLPQAILHTLPYSLARPARMLLLPTNFTPTVLGISHDRCREAYLSKMQRLICEISRLQQTRLRLRLPDVLSLPRGHQQRRLPAFLSALPCRWWCV